MTLNITPAPATYRVGETYQTRGGDSVLIVAVIDPALLEPSGAPGGVVGIRTYRDTGKQEVLQWGYGGAYDLPRGGLLDLLPLEPQP